MKRNRLALLIGLLMFGSVLTALAQSETVKQYTSKDVQWRVHETVDYQAKPEKGYKSFLGVSTDVDGKIYVADLTNVLIYDAKTGKSLGTLYDSTGTIDRYNDVAAAGDGNLWVSGSTAVYKTDPTGKILSTVAFKTSPGFSDRSPGDIEVDSAGNLYVSYGGNSLFLQVFSTDGEYIRTILSGVDRLQGVGQFVIAPDDKIYFVGGTGIGQVSEEDGKVAISEFAPEFMKEQNFIQFRGLAVDADGNVYFSAGSDGDATTSIFKLDKDGKLVGQYGKPMERANWSKDFGTDELSFTVAIALASDGALVISDTNNQFSQLIKVNMQK